MDIQFGNLSNLNLLWVVAAVIAVMVLAVVARRRAVARFATANLATRLQATRNTGRQFLKAALVTATLCALVLALIDIRWGRTWREVPQKGIEAMFVLDVSRSMLAEDASPNRLERAKQQISDMLEAMAGDRVGLVVFAGEARQLVPLTSHYHDFKQTLSDVGPQNVERGGSRLGDALRLAADGFLDQTGNHKAIVVFTDGDDQESDPVKVAENLHRDQGIRIFTVGLGDIDQGARIPQRQAGRQQSYLQHEGQQVWSKMNGAVLKQVALAADGAYIPAGTKQVDMAQVYHDYLANVDQQDFETARINSYVPRYQWFVGLGLLLLVLDTLFPAARRQSPAAASSVGWSFQSVGSRSNKTAATAKKSNLNVKSKGKGSAACLAMLFLLPVTASAAEPVDGLVRRANEALHAGNLDQALADYQQAGESDPNRPELLYNQAVAQYRKGGYEQARQLLAQAASKGDDRLDSRVHYNLGNCDYAEAVEVAEKDKSAAISKLRSAISNYRSTLATNSADTDARANIQTAQMLITKLQQEEKKQQQKPDQQKSDQQKSGQQKPGQQKPSSPNDEKNHQPLDKQEPQDNAPEQPEQQQPGSAQTARTQQFGHGDSTADADARPMTKEEAQKMLQAVRDRELLRRMEQRQKARRQHVPVDRDW